MSTKEYLDFDLLIEKADQGYVARVLFSPAGQAKREFTLPFTDMELELIMLRLGQPRKGMRRVESPEMETAKDFGGRLFKSIFDDAVQSCLLGSIDEAGSQGKGLRIRLRLDAPELAWLPWEYLYYPALDRFYAQNADTPIIRYIDLPERIRPLAVKSPLRVLAMISSPRDYEPLDVKGEWNNLLAAMQELLDEGKVILDRLDDASLRGLRKQLSKAEYHIFHFVGHGAFDKKADDGVLVFETEAESGTLVSGQDLGVVLQGHKSLRLAVINACEGARASASDPFSGVAQSLVRQGIPAVIAMQFEVSDKAAITFAHEFYSSILTGSQVDSALADARLAIFTDVQNLEWGTPVLFMRSPDGKIFDISQKVAKKPDQPPTGTGLSVPYPYLVFDIGGLAGQAIQLKSAKYILGREESPPDFGTSIVVPDGQVSRKHAQIWFETGKFQIKDLGSKNGTKVNDLPLLDSRTLNFGDKIQVGDTILIYRKEAEPKSGPMETKVWETGSSLPKPIHQDETPPSKEQPPQKEKSASRPLDIENIRIQIVRLFAQVDAARQQKNWELAVESLKAILNLDPKLPRARSELDFAERKFKCIGLYRQAQDAKAQKDWATAIECLETILRTEPERAVLSAIQDELAKVKHDQAVDRLLAEAQEAKAREDFSLAILKFQEVQKIDRNNPIAWNELNQLQQRSRRDRLSVLYEEAQAARAQGNYSQAILKLKTILEMDSANPQIRNELNEVQRILDQEKVDALSGEAQAALAQENYGLAIQKYQAILKTQPDNAKARFDLSEAQKAQNIVTLSAELQAAMAQGNWKLAIDKSEALLKVDPTLDDARQVLSYAQENLRLQNAELLYSQGMDHYQAGRFRPALDCFYKVKGLIADYKDVDQTIASIEESMRNLHMPLPRPPAYDKQSEPVSPPPSAKKESAGIMYELPGLDVNALTEEVKNYFQTNDYETQVVQQGPVTIVQGKKTGLRSMVGMGLATSVLLEATDYGVKVSIGGGKWAEQGAAIAVGLLSIYLIPFAITGGVGMFKQKQLIDSLWKLIDSYIVSLGGRRGQELK